MSLVDEFEQKLEGSCILLDTSAVTPHEETPLSHILYEGVGGLEMLNPALLSRRMNRFVELSQLVQTHDIVTIPQVHKEIERHLKILNGQHAFLKNEIYESTVEGELCGSMADALDTDVRYYTNMLDIINAHNLSLHQFMNRLTTTSNAPPVDERDARYIQFLDFARRFSKDLVTRSHRRKENSRHQVYLGEELETDQRLIATLFVLAYKRPVALLTCDNGLDELARRMYEFIVRGASPHALSIPPQTINICNTNNYDRRELEQSQQEAREFLSSSVYLPEQHNA